MWYNYRRLDSLATLLVCETKELQHPFVVYIAYCNTFILIIVDQKVQKRHGETTWL